MKTTDTKGIAFLSEMLKASIRSGTSPLLRSVKPQPTPEPFRQPTADEIHQAREDVATMARLLRGLVDARNKSDAAARNTVKATTTREAIAEAILRGQPVGEIQDPSETEKALVVTKATFDAANRHAAKASKAVWLLQSVRIQRAARALEEGEAAFKKQLPAEIEAADIDAITKKAPSLQSLRDALQSAAANPGGLIPTRLHTPMRSNPLRRGKLQASGAAGVVLHPWRCDPLPPECPAIARRDSWHPLSVANALDNLLAGLDATAAPVE